MAARKNKSGTGDEEMVGKGGHTQRKENNPRDLAEDTTVEEETGTGRKSGTSGKTNLDIDER
jgi:hypothetical protein